jgi:hypothetical protein
MYTNMYVYIVDTLKQLVPRSQSFGQKESFRNEVPLFARFTTLKNILCGRMGQVQPLNDSECVRALNASCLSLSLS